MTAASDTAATVMSGRDGKPTTVGAELLAVRRGKDKSDAELIAALHTSIRACQAYPIRAPLSMSEIDQRPVEHVIARLDRDVLRALAAKVDGS
jgi:hypothetical protein